MIRTLRLRRLVDRLVRDNATLERDLAAARAERDTLLSIAELLVAATPEDVRATVAGAVDACVQIRRLPEVAR